MPSTKVKELLEVIEQIKKDDFELISLRLEVKAINQRLMIHQRRRAALIDSATAIAKSISQRRVATAEDLT